MDPFLIIELVVAAIIVIIVIVVQVTNNNGASVETGGSTNLGAPQNDRLSQVDREGLFGFNLGFTPLNIATPSLSSGLTGWGPSRSGHPADETFDKIQDSKYESTPNTKLVGHRFVPIDGSESASDKSPQSSRLFKRENHETPIPNRIGQDQNSDISKTMKKFEIWPGESNDSDKR